MSSTSGAGGIHAGNAFNMATGEEKTEISIADVLGGASDTEEEVGIDHISDASESVHAQDQARSETSTGKEDAANTLFEGPASPAESSSIPDDTPSVQGSFRSSEFGDSTPLSITPVRAGFSLARSPFDRRFLARNTSSQLLLPRAASPALLTTHSRDVSISSQLSSKLEDLTEGSENTPKAWEVMKWTRLRKITNQAFSESGKRTFGRPTCVAVAAFIAIGTTKGLILLFDYPQTLKNIIGQGTAAAECGSITCLAISADHSTVAGAHTDGSIFTWEIARPAKPFLHIPPLDLAKATKNRVDGHISGSAVLHLGFLGNRRTALVSADKSGMAFSHLASRGLGAVARNVKSTRILGRYPEVLKPSSKSIKPSTVLAFQSLPLGNVEKSTDDIGLTALLTPYLLVIVSTTPVARTQHKAPKSAEVIAHSAMTGCLAWFPGVKLRNSDAAVPNVSKTKLVYSWSNVMTVLEIHEEYPTDSTDSTDSLQKPALHFVNVGQWKSEEAILAVQWLSRTIMAVLTVSQRLVILEDSSFRVLDSTDLNPRHLYHEDLFSRQLSSVVENLDQEDNSMHGVVPNAYYMSFKTYKGRLFILGMSDISLGTLLNWADRLMALVKTGNHIEAIKLATSYYTGASDRATINLPDDDAARQSLVKPKLLEMLTASLQYTFSDDENEDTEKSARPNITSLVEAAFAACMSMDEIDFLFDEVYEWYSDASAQDVFLYTLEPYVNDNRIRTIPPTVLKDLINWYAAHGFNARLEAMICSLDTGTMDVDQVASLCKSFKLFDALIYVWNQALEDYVTPLIELMKEAEKDTAPTDGYFIAEDDRPALKLFPYMAYTLTGRAYPSGLNMSASVALKAKASVYGFLFSSKAVKWPPGTGRMITLQPNTSAQPQYPYLHVLLHFDTADFMSMLNEVFEDGFLNGGQDQLLNGGRNADASNKSSGLAINRQRIVNILLELMNPPDYELEDIIYLDIFIARNLPRFPQFLLLPGSTLDVVLTELCKYPRSDLANECQLSAEYLLSVYHPTDIQGLIPLFAHAQFYNILKSTYRRNRQYSQWLEVHFEDMEELEAVFNCIVDCFRPSTQLSKKQIRDVKRVIVDHARDLCSIDVARTAQCLDAHAPEILTDVYEKLDVNSPTQYLFLKALFEPKLHEQQSAKRNLPAHLNADFTGKYVELMCKHEPNHVADYIALLESGDLRLNQVLPVMESSGNIDAAVVLLARDGLARDGMDRLLKHLGTLEKALAGLLTAEVHNPDPENRSENAAELVEAVQKYTKIGIWLCQGQTGDNNKGLTRGMSSQRRRTVMELTESDLTTTELLWLDLCDAIVRVCRAVTASTELGGNDESNAPATAAQDIVTTSSAINDSLRTTVQSTFTALLAATTSLPTLSSTTGTNAQIPPLRPTTPPAPIPQPKPPRFLPVLRLFLARTSTSLPTLSSLRSVLASIFAAYAFEASLLELAGAFIDKDVFADVASADTQRRRGWRPRTKACGGCGELVWGAGAGSGLWDIWERRRVEQEERDRESGASSRDEKGKGRAVHSLGLLGHAHSHGQGHGYGHTYELSAETRYDGTDERNTHEHEVGEGGENDGEVKSMNKAYDCVVVFACGHIFHKSCMHKTLAEKEAETDNKEGAVVMPHYHRHDHDNDEDGFKCPLSHHADNGTAR